MRRAPLSSHRLISWLMAVAQVCALVGGFRASAADWHEGVLPEVGPLLESEVIRTVGSRRLFATPTNGHRFWVRLPGDFDPDEPASLLLFHHGWYDGQDDINPWFHNWEGAFAGENMVWLKMSFRDNSSTSDAHQDSIKYAIAKVAASYKIVLGHGVLTGFSAGGLAASKLVSDHGGWPFNHVLAESMRFEVPLPDDLQPMSWTFAVGQNEWNSFNLGSTATARMNELVADELLGGSMDIHLHVVEGEGHDVTLSDDTIGPSVAAYRRSAAFLAPFVYQPDFSDAELAAIVDACQDLDLGTAEVLLSQFVGSGPGAGLLAKATQLQTLVENRVDQMFAILAELSDGDPALAEYYAAVASEQLFGHSREAEILSLAAAIRAGEGFASAANASVVWYDEMSGYLDNENQVRVHAGSVENVVDVRSQVAGESVVGQMSEEFLALNGIEYVPEPSATQLQLAGIVFLVAAARRRRVGRS